MAPKNKGGLGHREALDFVAELRRARMTTSNIRDQLQASGYKKSRISQLCPLDKTQRDASASSVVAAPVDGALQIGVSIPRELSRPMQDSYRKIKEIC